MGGSGSSEGHTAVPGSHTASYEGEMITSADITGKHRLGLQIPGGMDGMFTFAFKTTHSGLYTI